MKINVSQVKHKNLDALLMGSDLLAITNIPESGVKIQSIYDKEWKSELPEIMAMSDHIAVMCEGHLAGILDHAIATEIKTMALATSQHVLPSTGG